MKCLKEVRYVRNVSEILPEKLMERIDSEDTIKM